MIDELHDLALRNVRLRFALSSADFLARVRELAHAACGESADKVREHVLRLSLDDLYLASACVSGDEDAWRELGGAQFQFMRDFAARFVPRAAARDVADEVIAELWERKKLRQYGGRSTLRTWLGTVVAHAALNSRHAMNRMVALDSAVAAVAIPEPAGEQMAELLRQMLIDSVSDLPANERVLLQLYYEQGMTLDELSLTMRVSAPVISRRLKHSRETLRAGMEMRARRRTGESADALRAGLDLARIELDLGKLLGGQLSKHTMSGKEG